MDPEAFIKPVGSGQGGFPPASLAAKGGDVRNDLRLIDLLPFPLSVAAANAGLWRTQADDPVQDIAAVRLLIEGDIAWLHAAIEPREAHHVPPAGKKRPHTVSCYRKERFSVRELLVKKPAQLRHGDLPDLHLLQTVHRADGSQLVKKGGCVCLRLLPFD